jgi:hypothetical protein
VNKSVSVRKKVEDYIQANRPMSGGASLWFRAGFDLANNNLKKARFTSKVFAQNTRILDSGSWFSAGKFTDRSWSRLTIFSNTYGADDCYRKVDIQNAVNGKSGVQNDRDPSIRFRNHFLMAMGGDQKQKFENDFL